MIDEEIAAREAGVRKLAAIDRRLEMLATLADRADDLAAAAKEHPDRDDLADLVDELDGYVAEVLELSTIEAELIAAAAGVAMPNE
jgi:hypothetical protein